MTANKKIRFPFSGEKGSYFLYYLLSDLNEITAFGHLFDFVISSLDIEKMNKEKDEIIRKGDSPPLGVLLYLLKKEDYKEIKTKLMFIYLHTIFETYLSNLIRYHLRKHYGLIGKLDVDPEELMTTHKERIISKRVDKVTRNILSGNYSEIIKSIDKKFSLNIQNSLTSIELEELDNYKETRNQLVHLKTKIFQLPSIMQSDDEITHFEEELRISEEYVKDFNHLIVKIGQKIDRIFCKINPEIQN